MEPPLESAHLRLLRRLGVIPDADVERAVGHEQPQCSPPTGGVSLGLCA
jgi:hypothetical protein